MNPKTTEERPWGCFTILYESNETKIKMLNIKSNSVLSLQRHNHRSEHWTVISGKVTIQVGEDKKILEQKHTAYVPQGEWHRIWNDTKEEAHIVEIQTGSYFGEDDIERKEDVYGRV